MKRLFLLGTLMVMALQYGHAETGSDSVNVTLQNARRTIGYKGALVVDGKTVTLKNKTLTASAGNEIAVLVVNGGKLVLDHCTIQKTGDGIRSGGNGQRGQGRPEMGGQRGQGRPEMNGQGRPEMSGQRGQGRPEMNGQGRPEMGGQRGQGRPGRPGGGGGGNADDSFNFYGLNSAVVAVGEGSLIEMKGCTVTTDAEFANAVFSCDNAHVRITDGITIRTTKNSSRGLYATCAGVIEAEGVVDIDTKGAHCAALATDRGGGTVTVGSPNTKHYSRLNTAGSGSPCIYSTGDITAYKASGAALVSQTMVVEGKNTITIEDCSFSGKSPKHGGVMLYQSTSGDAKEGTSVLSMKKCTLRDNSGTAMFLVTNTHSIVNMEDCTFLDPEGKPLSVDYPLVTCRNCNGDGHNWGREGSNGGQVELNLVNQSLTGTLLANETESVITIKTDKGSAKKNLRQANGKGSIYNR